MKNYLHSLFADAGNRLNYLKDIKITFDIPKLSEHGDYSSNAAMLLAKSLKKAPKLIAQDIIANLKTDSEVISKIEIAGNGFINFIFTQKFLSAQVADIIKLGENYGRSSIYNGKKANVEFVSANPTGPLTVGHGRNAVCGDTIAKLLEWVGYSVDREYYFNNAGRQMRVLGDSVKNRYLELLGDKIDFPEDYYQGEYIITIANMLFAKFKDSLRDEDPEGIFKNTAESEIFEEIKKTLRNLEIDHKIFYNENDLYEQGKIKDLIKTFEEKSLSYQKEGAVWLRLTDMGNEADKVIVKSTGEPTYRLPDIAYHMVKMDRGYDLLIDIFGSDHAATYPDVLAALRRLGYDQEKVKVIIHQFVTVIKDGEIVKMSTRKANYITLDELTDEVGKDAVRYFFNMRSLNSHMNFDLNLAKEKSEENPVFYVQYAHARISSIIRMARDENISPSLDNLNLLASEDEIRLLKVLNTFRDEVVFAAENFDPQRITVYLEELAKAFHRFYTTCRIIGVEKRLSEARLALINAVKIVIANSLNILGVSAPEKM
ncbi:MAG: arginine--tRNA ligase [Ignavibacteriaceae bacterium]